MPHSDPARASGYRNTARRVSLAAALLLLATGCSADGPSPTAPDDELDPSLHRGAKGARTIVVSNAEELRRPWHPRTPDGEFSCAQAPTRWLSYSRFRMVPPWKAKALCASIGRGGHLPFGRVRVRQS